MRNALADLTSPQPPAFVRVALQDGRLRVGTRWPDDPRIVGRVVYRVRLPAGHPQLVCSGHVPCFPPAAPPGRHRFDVSFVDRWGGTSAPASSAPYAVGHD
jgi:hypothetical protein